MAAGENTVTGFLEIALEAARRDRRELPTLGLLGGDLCRTLGGRGDEARLRSRAAVLNLYDPNGKPRLRLKVDSLGAASLEFLDEQGTVTARLPERR